MGKIGIITYDYVHLKTEQILNELIRLEKRDEIIVYALPFLKRPDRKVIISHRPNQFESVPIKEICEKNDIQYIVCYKDIDIDDKCDIYIITGAGILSEEMLKGKRVINCHPGIIPIARGLDAFKWSIYNLLPLGVTLHYIDKNVDCGEIIYIQETPVYPSDTINSLCRRHYENEIYVLSHYYNYLDNKETKYIDSDILPANHRMSNEYELDLEKKFVEYKKKYCSY